MSRSLAILFSLLLAFAPAASLSASECCCAPAPAETGVAAPTDAECCETDEAPRSLDDQPGPGDELPCDCIDCAVMCCSVVKTLGVSHRAAPPLQAGAHTAAVPTQEPARGSPHLMGLKRPPRVSTTH